jgi:pimeloyl-ACP methyl ester carboxylesterase
VTWERREVEDLVAWSSGEGARHLLLLHGGPGLSEYTAELGDLLADALGNEWTVSRFQQRGLAPSTTDGPFTVEQHVADTLRVCAALTADPIVLVGHSWGGHLALHVVAAAPQRFDALVCIDPLGAIPDGGEQALGQHLELSMSPEERAARETLGERALSGEQPLDEVAVEDLALVWPHYFSDPALAPPMPPMSMSVDTHLQTWASIRSHFERQTLERALPRLGTLTLFLAATKSPIPLVESERSAALLPNAMVATVPTGHFTWLEDRTGTTEAIANFLR